VVEERGPEIRAGPTGPRGGAARRGPRAGETPRRRRRAIAERSVGRPARGPAREGQNRLEDRSCKGSVRRAKEILGGAGVLARDKANRAEK
jgi:hypothetical protein